MAEKVTAPQIRAMKGSGRKVVCLTAYDAVTAALADEGSVDLILVGDSVGNVMLGYASTLPVSLEAMVHHTAAAARGTQRALFVADMPFGSYQSSVSQAVDSAVDLVKAGAEAIKLEGAYLEEIRAIVRAGIPVMGHVGMTPQSVNAFGGHRVQGKGDSSSHVIEAAKAIDEAGVFSMVLELIPASLSKEITSQVSCPTIGIGAGPDCDGQIQVFHDVVGLTKHSYKHAKRYSNGYRLFGEAIASYAEETRAGEFPTSENSF